MLRAGRTAPCTCGCRMRAAGPCSCARATGKRATSPGSPASSHTRTCGTSFLPKTSPHRRVLMTGRDMDALEWAEPHSPTVLVENVVSHQGRSEEHTSELQSL